MKSYNADNRLKEPEIIRNALIKVCKSKKKKRKGPNRKYKQARYILAHLDEYVEKTLEIVLAFEVTKKAEELGQPVLPEIYEKSYKPVKCISTTIKDRCNGKTREITTNIPLFPDQVMHQLLIEAGQPAFMRGMYRHSYSSIPGRGVHDGAKFIKKTINHHTKCDKSAIKYVGQLDITQCYPSVSHNVLKQRLRKKFRGKLFLWLCFAIIDSYAYAVKDGENYGLPTGCSTSPWFCNFILTPLDHYIKEDLHIEYYIRYLDDMVFFGRNKRELHKAVNAIIAYCASMGLIIKVDHQVYRFDYIDRYGKRRGRAIDVLGFRFFRDKTILRKRNALAIRRQVQKVAKMPKVTAHEAQSLMSRLGSLRHCNSYNFYHKYVKPYIKIRKLKGVIRSESRKHSNASCAV